MKNILGMFKKADFILLAVLLVIGFALSAVSVFSASAGTKAVITVDGELYGTYSLAEEQEITVEQNGHINKITIKDGRAQMTYSTCKNQVCVESGAIGETNESIVCLPNRVMVEITGGEGEFDAVA